MALLSCCAVCVQVIQDLKCLLNVSRQVAQRSCQTAKRPWHHHDITLTSPKHPAMLWTCRWVKWPTALILHVKLSVKDKKKKKRERERKRMSPWQLFFFSVIGHKLVQRRENKTWRMWGGGGWGTRADLFFSHHVFSASLWRRLDGWGGETFHTLASW